jgi:membrane associated rhomboid family serine protease
VGERERICPECGVVYPPLPDDRCAMCGLTALDPDDPAQRDAIDEAIRLRQQLLTPTWPMVVIGLAYMPVVIGAMHVTKSESGGQLLGMLVIVGLALLVNMYVRSRMTPGWRLALERARPHDRGLALRRWTSTTAIAAALCIAFVGVRAIEGIEALAYWRGAEPWRIVTSALTHAGSIHLAGNMLALATFGLAIDLRVGRALTAVILAAAAIAGALAQAAYSETPMVGFSAAVYGLIGATVVLLPTRPTLLTLQGMAIPLPTWAWTMIMIPLFTFTAWADQRGHVAWVAHLGGFVAGALVAVPMRWATPTRWFARVEEERARRIERLASR